MKILATAPTRISLFGGGTDIDIYSKERGGVCVSLAINIRQHVEIDESVIGHIIPEKASHEFYKIIFSEMDQPLPSGLFCSFDGPIESGLGSSAAATVALIGAIAKAQNIPMTRQEIAERAWDIEVNKIGLYGGKQDQYASSFGGFNVLEFGNRVSVIPVEPEFIYKLLPSMSLFYLGENRKSAKIQENFRDLTKSKLHALDMIKQTTLDSLSAIATTDIRYFGQLMHNSWEYKKESNPGVTNELIDRVYAAGWRNGAYGGKVLGAGGGGHMLFISPPDNKERFIKEMELEGIKHVDFSPDFNGLETRVI